MAAYRNISLGFWVDPKVECEFTPEDRYFFLFILTNAQTSISGCYELSIGQMAKRTGYNEETCKRLIQRLDEVHNVILYDFESQEVLIKNWYKYNWAKSEKTQKGVQFQLQTIKSEMLKNEVNRKITEFFQKPKNWNTEKNKFNRYPQNDYGDMDKLERELLGD